MQPILKESDFRKELKKEPRLGYLFFGDEDYLKTFAIKLARETLCPDPTYAFFNEFFLDAVDFAPDKLLDALMPMPMMADKKLVVVRGLNFNGIRQGELDELCDVLAHLSEYDYNLLIFHVSADCINPGRLPSKPSATLSALAEYLTPVQFDRCTGTKLTAWMQKHFAHNGVNASAELCSEMSDYCGHSMFVLAGEIDKLSFYARYHQKDTVTAEDMRLVCTPTPEYDVYAFTNAIMNGRQDLALAILNDYRYHRIDPVIIMGEVSRLVCDMVTVRSMLGDGLPSSEIASLLKMHEFKLGLYMKSLRNTTDEKMQKLMDACLSADFSLKRSGKGYEPLERLICTI
ncbi:MAG: DNA polymerase III subunit delta [Ruminococcaceae bacterium]|nr:DNA polymerase III subunit delta [Oscillospiraceae bacterium]